MKFYGFSGPRSLTCAEEWFIESYLMNLIPDSSGWSVGDVLGVDALVKQVAERVNIPLTVFWVQGNERYHFAKRSKAMVDSILGQGGQLIAFPNRPCPKGCYPSASVVGAGSGTWLTIAYASYRKVPVTVIPLDDRIKLPHWLETNQMSLF